MHDDLNKAENRWRNRPLFRNERRPWGRFVLWLLLLGMAAWGLYRQGLVAPWIEQIAGMTG